MDKHFASQLANLQRVASRAGNNNTRDDERARDTRHHHHGPRDAMRYDRRDNYNRKRRREDDDWRNGRNYRRSGCDYHGARYNNRRDREDRQPSVPLADLVKNVAEQYNKRETDIINHEKRRHIALLFLTIDDLPHEHVWREWLSSGDKDDASDDIMVSIICHAKFPERIKSPWLRQRHLIRFNKPVGNEEIKDNISEASGQQPIKLHSRRPEWGSIEITRAMIDLLEEGLRIGSKNDANGTTTSENKAVRDEQSFYKKYISTPTNASDEYTESNGIIPAVDRFIFVSESCLPVTTLKEVEMALFGPNLNNKEQTNHTSLIQKKSLYDKSWVNARSTPNNGYSRQLQWDEIRSSDIPPHFIWKADQWIVLNRAHGEAVVSISSSYLNGYSLWHAFRTCRASDEIYFPTVLSILGIIARPTGVEEVEDMERNESCAGDQIRRRKVTYCDWSVSAKNPASFSSKDLEEVAMNARREGCLFARKFVPSTSNLLKQDGQAVGFDGIVSVEDWLSVMLKLKRK